MTNKPENPPAFPHAHNFEFAVESGIPTGMTLRDYFAGKALVIMLRSWDGKMTDDEIMTQWAESAYIVADKMLKARAA